ncbi:MAG: aminotransferase class IV [Bacteroidetes bacterium]|nr:aminotransferase class IV [Bacteroidota bacterium]
MAIAFYNNTYVEDTLPVIQADNRAFRYGDGLFESMVAFDNVVPLLPYHYERLRHSAEILMMELHQYMDFDWFKATVMDLLSRNKTANARIRIQLTRAGTGLYKPEINTTDLLITCTAIPNNRFEWSSINATFSPYRVDTGVLSNLKTTSKIQYVLSALLAEKKGASEAFLFNTKGTLAEAVQSNVFLIKGDLIMTPALTNGGVNGVMRRYVIGQLEETFNVVQSDVLMNDIDEADEIFVTNAVRGIQSVAVVGSVVYSDAKTRDIFAMINQGIRQMVLAGKS